MILSFVSITSPLSFSMPMAQTGAVADCISWLLPVKTNIMKPLVCLPVSTHGSDVHGDTMTRSSDAHGDTMTLGHTRVTPW